MNFGIEGRVALVTGASAGLGLAAAEALAAEGAEVAIVSRSKENIEKAASGIHARTGRLVRTFTADVGDTEALSDLVARVRAALGPLSILVSNAGGPPAGRFEELTPESFDLAHRLTFLATVELCRRALPDMTAQKWGRVIVITSTAARQPIDGLLLSNSYRAGLTGFLKTLSREYGDRSITFNSVAPGYTQTERLAHLGDRVAKEQGKTLEQVYAMWAEATPLKRLGRPEEIGAAVAWLASEPAGFITGQQLVVDGGRTAGLP